MKQVTDNFKNNIKTFGRQLNFKVQVNNIDISEDDINYIKPSFNSKLFQTIMHKLEIDSKNKIPLKSKIKISAGVKVNEPEYEYVSYSTYIVDSCERQEDTNSYISIAYDKMIESMIDYDLNILKKIKLREYLIKICERLGWNTNNIPATFINSEKLVDPNLHVGIKYTFRDVLDEIATISCSFLLFKGEDFYLIYPTETNQDIDEEYLNEDNVIIGEKYFINSLVFSRAEESDNIYRNDATNIELNGLHEYRISDNQLLSTNDRDLYIDEMWEYLKTFEFYIFDVSSKGILFLEACDRFNFVLSGNTYSTILLNNEIAFEDGLTEELYIDKPEETETEYKYADTTDKRINKAYLLVDKQNQTIQAVIEETNELQSQVTDITTTQATLEGTEIKIDDSAEEPIIKLEIDGHSEQAIRSGKNLLNINLIRNSNIIIENNGQKVIMPVATSGNGITNANVYLYQICPNLKVGDTVILRFETTSAINKYIYLDAPASYLWNVNTELTITEDILNSNFNLYGNRYSSGETEQVTITNLSIMLKNETNTNWEQFGAMPSPEYPSEMQSIADDINLWDLPYIFELTKQQEFIRDIPAGTYTLNAEDITSNYADKWTSLIVFYYEDGTNKSIYIGGTQNKFTTTSFEKKVVKFIIYSNNGWSTSQETTTIFKGFKLQKGTVATPYSEYGKGTVEVKQTGKNLYKNSSTFVGETFSGELDKEVLHNGDYSIKTEVAWKGIYVNFKKICEENKLKIGDTITHSVYFRTNFLPAKNMLFTLYRVRSSGGYAQIAVPQQEIKSGEWNRISFTFEVNEYTLTATQSRIECDYWDSGDPYYFGNNRTNYIWFASPQVEIGELTEYEEYRGNNYVIPTTPLRSLPNGVKDTIEEDGIHRRIGSVVLDGSDDETYGVAGEGNTTDGFSMYSTFLVDNISNVSTKSLRSNYFTFIERAKVNSNSMNFITGGGATSIVLNIDRSLLETEDVAGFKKWLQQSPIQVDYELAEEVIEPFDEEQQAVINSIETMLGTQYFKSDANMRITYVRDNGLIDMFETKQSASKRSAQLQIQIDEISSKVESVEDLTQGATGTKTITLDNCAKGYLLKLQIKGNNEVFKYLYPSDTLYPSNTLYPYGDSRIKVTNDEGEKIYELGVMEVLRVNGNVYDEYILENGIAKVIRRINTNGTVKTVPTEEVIGEYSIDVAEGTNTIEIVNYSATMNVLYAIKSNFTEVFSTKVETDSKIQQKADEIDIGVNQKLENYSTTTEMHSAINVKADAINSEVSKKVGNDEIISKINQSAEAVGINANKIELSANDVLNLLAGNTINLSSKNIVISSDALTIKKDGTMILKGANSATDIFRVEQSSNSSVFSYVQPIGAGYVNGSSDRSVYIFVGDSSSSVDITDANGNTYIAGKGIRTPSVTQTSIEKDKKNFEILNNGLEIIKNTDIYKYNLKSQKDTDKKHIGFVIGDKYNYSEEITSENNDGVDTYSMISVAYKAIQELAEQNKQLQNEIKQLKGENNG